MARASSPSRPALRLALIASVTAVAVALSACGGDNGPGGNFKATMHVLVVNHTPGPVNVTYSGGAPLSTSADKPPIATCKAGIIDYPLVDPFTLSVNDKVIIDSSKLDAGIPNNGESDVVTQIDVTKDNGVVLTLPLQVGSKISPPAQLGICL